MACRNSKGCLFTITVSNKKYLIFCLFSNLLSPSRNKKMAQQPSIKSATAHTMTLKNSLSRVLAFMLHRILCEAVIRRGKANGSIKKIQSKSSVPLDLRSWCYPTDRFSRMKGITGIVLDLMLAFLKMLLWGDYPCLSWWTHVDTWVHFRAILDPVITRSKPKWTLLIPWHRLTGATESSCTSKMAVTF